MEDPSEEIAKLKDHIIKAMYLLNLQLHYIYEEFDKKSEGDIDQAGMLNMSNDVIQDAYDILSYAIPDEEKAEMMMKLEDEINRSMKKVN